MASRLNPYVNFDGNAREAVEFYRRVFGGELTVSTYSDFGDAPPTHTDKIMHSQLETDRGFTLMVADTAPGTDYNPGNNVSISLSGDDGDELRGYWDQLSEGGQVLVPLERQMWGDEFGMCMDRFGITWLVNIAQAQS